MSDNLISQIHFIEDSEDEVFISRLLLESQRVEIDLVHHTSYEAFVQSTTGSDMSLPVIVFVDLNMPDIKGTEIIRLMQEAGRYPTLISGICTGSEDPADQLSAQRVGASFFIRKPLDVNALRCVCKTVGNLEVRTSCAGTSRLYSVA